MPAEAAAMIRENVKWQTPGLMVPSIQASFPTVTAQQIHTAWMKMSETIWKRHENQLDSA
jgi:hypothetical protein